MILLIDLHRLFVVPYNQVMETARLLSDLQLFRAAVNRSRENLGLRGYLQQLLLVAYDWNREAARRFSDLLQLVLGAYDQSLENMSLLGNFSRPSTGGCGTRACSVICSRLSSFPTTGVWRPRA